MRYTRLPRAGSPLFPSARPTLLVTSIILIITIMMIMILMVTSTILIMMIMTIMMIIILMVTSIILIMMKITVIAVTTKGTVVFTMTQMVTTQPYHDKSDLTCQSKWFGELFPDLLGNSCQSGNLTRGKLGREPEKGNGLGNLTRKTDTTKYPPWSEEGGAEDEQLNTNTKHQLIANSVSE